MLKMKTFNEGYGDDTSINQWLKENPSINITKVYTFPMYDVYANEPPKVCNMWRAVMIFYTGKEGPE